MLKIYVAHSREFDFKQDLYLPLRSSSLNEQYEFFLPHETDQFINSKDIIKQSQLVVAEVSYPATGQGIELGWAESMQVPIICFYKEGVKPSGSLKAVSKTIVPYTDAADLLKQLENFLTVGDFPNL